MRAGTILVLLAFILLFAFLGVRFFSWLLAFFFLTLLVGILAVVLGIWVIKRRMRRKLAELGLAVEQRLRRQAEDRGMRQDAIDVEGDVRHPRDGADDPDGLDPGQERR